MRPKYRRFVWKAFPKKVSESISILRSDAGESFLKGVQYVCLRNGINSKAAKAGESAAGVRVGGPFGEAGESAARVRVGGPFSEAGENSEKGAVSPSVLCRCTKKVSIMQTALFPVTHNSGDPGSGSHLWWCSVAWNRKFTCVSFPLSPY